MKIRSYLFLFAIANMAFLSGCASSVEQLEPGSRAGVINQIYSQKDLRVNPPTCLYSLTQTQTLAGKYVQVRVPQSRGYKFISAFVPASITVQIGDEVEFAPERCSRESIPEVKLILKHRS